MVIDGHFVFDKTKYKSDSNTVYRISILVQKRRMNERRTGADSNQESTNEYLYYYGDVGLRSE